MSTDSLLASLLALSDEGAAAQAADLPWPGEQHVGIRASDSYSAFAEAATAQSRELGRLMAGASLTVTHVLGGYSVGTPDGAWVVARLLDDGTRLAATQGLTACEDVHRALGQALDGLLDALSSGRCRTTVYLGLRGISLLGAYAADVGVGVLRSLTSEELRAFAADGDRWPPSEDELCLVMECESTWTVSDQPPRSDETPPLASMPLHDLFSVLLMLAGARNSRGFLRAPHVIWTRPVPYFFQGGGSSHGSNPDLHWRGTESIWDGIVTPDVAAEARRLFPSLSSAPAESLRVASHRLVSAGLVYNKKAEDRLVDAAVAWESLFGSRDRDQLSLQLALGIAWLLAPDDYAEREPIFSRAKKIYALRSKLVHGGGVQKAKEVETAADELIEWLRQALIALVTTHAPLLSDKDRVQRLLLQDPSNCE